MDAKWNSIQKLNCPTQYVWTTHTIQLLATIFAESNLIGLRCHFIFYHKWRFMRELVRNMRDGFHFMPFHFIALHVTKIDKNSEYVIVLSSWVRFVQRETEKEEQRESTCDSLWNSNGINFTCTSDYCPFLIRTLSPSLCHLKWNVEFSSIS